MDKTTRALACALQPISPQVSPVSGLPSRTSPRLERPASYPISTTETFRGSCYAGGSALVALSAAINVRHVIAHVGEPADAVLLGSLAVAMTLGFAVLPSVASSAAREGQYALAGLAVLASIICGAISLTNIAGASMRHRMEIAADATDAKNKRADARRQIEVAERDLAKLPLGRPSSTIEAEINAKLTSRSDLDGCSAKWLTDKYARSVCSTVEALRAEFAGARRRAEIEARIADAQRVLNNSGSRETVGSGDTQAVLLAIAKFGVTVDATTVDLAKSLGTALAVELFAAILFIVGAKGRVRETQATAARELQGSALPAPASPRISVSIVRGADEELSGTVRGRPLAANNESEQHRSEPDIAGDAAPDTLAGRMVELLRGRGGTVVGSQRSIGRMLGASKSAVNDTLRTLADAGLVKVTATSRTTVVELVAAA